VKANLVQRAEALVSNGESGKSGSVRGAEVRDPSESPVTHVETPVLRYRSA